MKTPPCLGCQSASQPADSGSVYVNAFVAAACLFATEPRQLGLYLGALCLKHRITAALVMTTLAERNGSNVKDLMRALEAVFALTREQASVFNGEARN